MLMLRISPIRVVCGEMNRKGLAILMRTRMRTTQGKKLPSTANDIYQSECIPSTQLIEQVETVGDEVSAVQKHDLPMNQDRIMNLVHESMHAAIVMNKTETADPTLEYFSQGYLSFSHDNRRKLLLILAKDYNVNRIQLRELMKQYLSHELCDDVAGKKSNQDEEHLLSAFYRIERNIRHALMPMYEVLFERLNAHPGGLRFLSTLRADILSVLAKENISSLHALDSYLKEKLITWLSPANLELHQITWDDPASLLEKIVAYEAVHPISSLIDLKRRLGVGRCCFTYLHPAIPGEPLIFIEVALMKNVARTVQEVLWDNPPTPECEATCALFYSISATQPGLAGVNLGKFLIKRVIEVVKREMPHILRLYSREEWHGSDAELADFNKL